MLKKSTKLESSLGTAQKWGIKISEDEIVIKYEASRMLILLEYKVQFLPKGR